MAFHSVEEYFAISEGLLESLSQNENFNEICAKLKNYVESEQPKIIAVKSQLEESLFENSQLRLVASNLEDTVSKTSCDLQSLTAEKVEFEKTYAEAIGLNSVMKKQCENIEANYNSCCSEIKTLKKENEDFSLERNELLATIDRKNCHIEQINEEFKEMNEKYLQMSSEKKELKSLLNESSINKSINDVSSFSTFKLSTSHLEIRIQELQKSLQDTMEDYKDKLYSRDSTIDALTIDIKCREKQIDLCNLELKALRESKLDFVAKFKEIYSTSETFMGQTEAKINGLDERIHMVEKFYQLQTQTIKETNEKFEEYLRLVERLQSKIKLLERDKFELNQELSNQNTESHSRIEELERELRTTKKELTLIHKSINSYEAGGDVLPSAMLDKELIEHMSPIAVNTSKFLNRGYTLTDIYSEYIKEHSELISYREEVMALKNKIHIYSKESSSLSGTLKQLKNDNTSLTDVNSSLSKKLDCARKEILIVGNNSKELNNKINLMNIEMKKLQSIKQDLSSQIQHLLVDSQKTKARKHSTFSLETQDSKPLPLFSSVAELQTVNCKLLETIHELEYEIEIQNKETHRLTIADYVTKIQDLETEIAEKNNAIEKNREMYDITCQQRDMYRVLYQQKYAHDENRDNSAFISNLCPQEFTVLELENAKNESNLLQSKLTAIKEEFDEYKNKSELLISSLRHDNSLMSGEFQLIKTQLLHQEKENSQLLNNISNLNERFSSQEKLCDSLQQSKDAVKRNRDSLFEELESLKTAHRNLITDQDSLKYQLKHFEMENEFLRQNAVSNASLLSQLHDMNSQLTKYDKSQSSEVFDKVNSMNDEIQNLRLQVIGAISEFHSEKSILVQENTSIKFVLESERQKNSIHHETIKKREQELSLANQEIDKLLVENKSLRNSVTNDCQEENTHLIELVDQLKKEISSLNTQVLQYKSISESSELKISQLIQQQTQLCSTFDNERENWFKEKEAIKDNEIISLAQKLNEAEQNLKNIQNNKNSSVDNLSSEYKQEIENLTKKLEQSSSSYEKLRSQYDSIIIGHADAINRISENAFTVTSLESTIMAQKTRIIELEDQIKNKSQKLKDRELELNQWESNKKIEEKQMKDHIEAMYVEVGNLRQKIEEMQSSGSNSQIVTETKSEEGVWNLVGFSRKEKNMIEAQLNASQTECLRLSKKIAQLKDTIVGLEKTLQSEREVKHSMISSFEDLSQYKDAIQIQNTLLMENEDFKRKISKYEENLADLTNQLSISKETTSRLQEGFDDLKNKYDDSLTKFEMSSLEVNSLRNQLKAEQVKIKSQQKTDNEQLMQKYNEALHSRSIAQEENDRLKSKLELQINHIKKLQSDIESANSKIVVQAKEIKTLNENYSELSKRKSLLEKAIEDEIKANKRIASIQKSEPAQETLVPPNSQPIETLIEQNIPSSVKQKNASDPPKLRTIIPKSSKTSEQNIILPVFTTSSSVFKPLQSSQPVQPLLSLSHAEQPDMMNKNDRDVSTKPPIEELTPVSSIETPINFQNKDLITSNKLLLSSFKSIDSALLNPDSTAQQSEEIKSVLPDATTTIVLEDAPGISLRKDIHKPIRSTLSLIKPENRYKLERNVLKQKISNVAKKIIPSTSKPLTKNISIPEDETINTLKYNENISSSTITSDDLHEPGEIVKCIPPDMMPALSIGEKRSTSDVMKSTTSIFSKVNEPSDGDFEKISKTKSIEAFNPPAQALTTDNNPTNVAFTQNFNSSDKIEGFSEQDCPAVEAQFGSHTVSHFLDDADEKEAASSNPKFDKSSSINQFEHDDKNIPASSAQSIAQDEKEKESEKIDEENLQF